MNKYQVLLDKVNEGHAILTAGRIHDDIPTIHDCGHSLKSDIDIVHCGFGLFRGRILDQDYFFDAGGAMNRITDSNSDYIESWTILSASHDQLITMGYNIESVKLALESFNE